MDACETIPCVVDSLSYGRLGAGHLLNHAARTAATIVKPQMRDRGTGWLGASSGAHIETFHLPAHRMAARPGRCDVVRYIADTMDEQWVAKMSQTLPTARGGKVGPMTPSKSSNHNELSIDILEKVFTALEFAARADPSISIQRLHVDPKTLGDIGGINPSVSEMVTQYWKSKRRANGGLALISLASIDDVNGCQADVLGDCPLPFATRDGQMYASLQLDDLPNRKRSRNDDDISSFVILCRRLAGTILQREEAFVQLAQVTLYELASLRRTAVGR